MLLQCYRIVIIVIEHIVTALNQHLDQLALFSSHNNFIMNLAQLFRFYDSLLVLILCTAIKTLNSCY